MLKKFGKLTLFYKIFWSVFAVLTVLLLAAVLILNVYLKNYEAALPKTAAKGIFEEIYLSADTAKIASAIADDISEFDADTDVKGLILERLNEGKLDFYALGADGEDEVWCVRAGDKRISKFTLKKSGKTLSGGYDEYVLDELRFYFDSARSVSITAPSHYEVYINGVLVGSEYAVQEDIPTASKGHLPSGVEEPTNTRYEIDGILGDVTVSTSAEGAVIASEADDYYVNLAEDTALCAEYAGYVIEAAQTYAAYMQSDLGFSSVAKYFEAGTKLYEQTRIVENYFVIDHSGYSFRDVSATEFYAYDEDTFSCRISFVHHLHRAGLEDYRDFFDITFFLRRVGDKFMIYDCYTNPVPTV